MCEYVSHIGLQKNGFSVESGWGKKKRKRRADAGVSICYLIVNISRCDKVTECVGHTVPHVDTPVIDTQSSTSQLRRVDVS